MREAVNFDRARFDSLKASHNYMKLYKVTNKINGLSYIGQTTRSIEERWKEHCKPSLRHRSYLSNAIQKYGEENFILEELNQVTIQDELDALEKNAINEHNTMWPNGYNLRDGGLGGKHSDEAKEKCRKASTGRILSEESRAKIRVAVTGKVYKHLRKKIEGTNIKTNEKIVLDCAGEGQKLGFDTSCIWKCAAGKRKQYKGYTWKYI